MQHQLPQYTRRDGTVVEPEVIALGKASRRTVDVQVTEPVVDLEGNVQSARVDSRLQHRGLCLVEEVHGELVLTGHAKQLGYVFYRDMCLGRVDGVAPSPIHWKIYMAVKTMVAKGQRPARGALPPEKLYHPEVIRRKKETSASGIKRISAKDMDWLIESIREQGPDDDDAREAARARGLTVPDEPVGDLASLLREAEGA